MVFSSKKALRKVFEIYQSGVARFHRVAPSDSSSQHTNEINPVYREA